MNVHVRYGGQRRICARQGHTRIQCAILQDERRLRMAPRRDKNAQSPFPSFLEPALEHLTAPFHKSLMLVNRVEKPNYKLGCLRREAQFRCHGPSHAGRAPCKKACILHRLHQSTRDARDVFCASSRRIRESISPCRPSEWKVLFPPQVQRLAYIQPGPSALHPRRLPSGPAYRSIKALD